MELPPPGVSPVNMILSSLVEAGADTKVSGVCFIHAPAIPFF
jgi:hypothetical protein